MSTLLPYPRPSPSPSACLSSSSGDGPSTSGRPAGAPAGGGGFAGGPQSGYSGQLLLDGGRPQPGNAREAELVAYLDGRFDLPKLMTFFQRRPWAVAGRLGQLLKVSAAVVRAWQADEGVPEGQRTRGQALVRGLNEMGPVFVKMGQTLSARADLVGKEAAEAMGTLTDNAIPFSTDDAMATMADALQWSGPIAPGVPGPWVGDESACRPEDFLFQELSKEPVAAASLGQVYRGCTWDGREIAVKVQRPGLLWSVALDMYVLKIGLILLKKTWNSKNDIAAIADEVGAGIWRELDYRQEAKNARDFEREHAFLGYVRSVTSLPEYTCSRVLTMDWCHGKKLNELEPADQLDFMAKAIECSGAQILQSGFVHADPHAGNIMYEDGDLVYLDFGLVSRVEDRLMEAFASGIIHLIGGNWEAFAQDFVDMDLVPADFGRLNAATGVWEECSIDQFCVAVREMFNSQGRGGGQLTQFGDLVIGVQKLADEYKFCCPAYTIILVRTFATLEGLAALVDENFNMYEACLPYAIRRGLAPSTTERKAALRGTLFAENGELSVEGLKETIDMVKKLQAEEANASSDRPEMSPMTKQITAKGPAVVGNLAYTPGGSVVRRLAYDVHTDDLMDNVLQGARSKDVQQAGVGMVASALQERLTLGAAEEEPELKLEDEVKPVSAFASRALRTVLNKHLSQIFTRPRGLFFLARLGLIVLRVGAAGVFRGVTSAFLLSASKFCSWLGAAFRGASQALALQKPSRA